MMFPSFESDSATDEHSAWLGTVPERPRQQQQAYPATQQWQPTQAPSGQQAYQAAPQEPFDSGTDSDTVSTEGSMDYNAQDLQGLTPAQVDEHLFWQYQKHKSRWRKHMRKPTRRVRRFVKRRFGGKSRGKGRSRFGFLAEMDDVTYDNTFFGGKGNSKGRRRSSGFGRGRRKNPKGADGNIMKCHGCGSEDHLKADCPQASGGGGTMLMFNLVSNAYRSGVAAGPLGDLLGPRSTQNMMTK